jgi:hypothetical protein
MALKDLTSSLIEKRSDFLLLKKGLEGRKNFP